ncbi:MAG: C40 family peptidase [Bacteroidales bacterium]|nr:C40 family peptidase [Clostridium sp.]MCM1204882.1 C40 family peptidase [Bacteroidales bacterium]
MKHNALLRITFILLLGILALSPIRVEAAGAVKLNKTSVVLDSGETFLLKVKNTAEKVRWTTSAPDVAEVKKGEITAKTPGTAVVTAEVNGTYYTCKVVVADFSDMSAEQEEVVSYALQHLGNPYVYGGSSLTKGTDCSGFTMAVYQKFGYNLYHNAYMQMQGTQAVNMSQIQPGDLIFYGRSKSSCSHVALYIGGGKVIHASTEITGIVISDYNYRQYVGVGRVLKTGTYLTTGSKKKTSAKKIALKSVTTLSKNSISQIAKKGEVEAAKKSLKKASGNKVKKVGKKKKAKK